MIGNLKKYIDKASFMEHIDAKLRQNEPMIIDSFVSNKCNLKCRHCYFGRYRSQPFHRNRYDTRFFRIWFTVLFQ